MMTQTSIPLRTYWQFSSIVRDHLLRQETLQVTTRGKSLLGTVIFQKGQTYNKDAGTRENSVHHVHTHCDTQDKKESLRRSRLYEKIATHSLHPELNQWLHYFTDQLDCHDWPSGPWRRRSSAIQSRAHCKIEPP